MTILKGHYMYLWYVAIFISTPQVICELWGLAAVLFLGKRRW